jgi:hypothetical protein
MRLLRLILADLPDAAELAAWTREVDIEALDEGSVRLLPSLYRRLSAAGVDHPWLPRMRGWHRRSFYLNRLLIHRGLRVVRTLASQGMPALLLKGSALGPRCYGDLGERPMGDFDILIPEDVPLEAVTAALTKGAGLVPRDRALHALTFLDRDRLEIDVHRHLLPELAYRGSSRSLWERAEPIELEGETWRTLSAEDHVFHILVHGLRASDVPPLRWIVDTAAVLRARPRFDWSLVVEQARRTATAAPVAAGLAFMAGAKFLGPAGEAALRELQAVPVGAADRFLFAGQMRRPGFAYSCLRPFLLYARLNRLAGAEPSPGFRQFLAALWNLESPRKVPGAALGKLGARLRARTIL